jgi:hypothetical protein
MLTIDFNLAQVKVEGDLMEIGIKQFTKTALLEGPKVLLPADLMPTPNAIKDIRAAAGVRAYITTNLTGDNNDLKFTAVEPGTTGNGISVVYVEDPDYTGDMAVQSVNFSTRTITVIFNNENGEVAEDLMNAINNHLLASSLVTASLKDGNDGTGTLADNTATLANGTGTGWKPADEKTVKDSNRMEENYIEAASENYPKYVIKGNLNEARMLEFYPKTITWSELIYDYTIAEMTEDTDTLTIPLQYRELVLIEVIRKAYESLDMTDKMATRTAEYNAKLSKVYDNYQKGLNTSLSEKLRIEKQD